MADSEVNGGTNPQDTNFDCYCLEDSPGSAKIDSSLFPGTFKFVVPYHDEPDFLDKMTPWRQYIDRIYLPIPAEFMGSGRPWLLGTDPGTYKRTLPGVIKAMEEKGFNAELLCNSTMPEWEKTAESMDYIGDLVDCGLRYLTAAFLPFAALLRKTIPTVELTASTVAFIHDTARLERWLEETDVKVVCPDRSVNKKLRDLALMRKTGVSLRLVVDDGCLPSCPHQFQHYLLLSRLEPGQPQNSVPELAAVERLCRKTEREYSWRILQHFVVPGDIPKYASVVDTIKFGRGYSKNGEHVVKEMLYYTNTANRCHFYLGYHDPEQVFEKIQECDRICRDCHWCKEVFYKYNVPAESSEGQDTRLWRPRER